MTATKRLPVFLWIVVGIGLSACSKPPADPEGAAPRVTEQASQVVAGEVSGELIAEETEQCVGVPPKQDFACPMVYLPVCGCDDKTYSNACMAKAAGITDVTPGECGGAAK